MINLNNPKQIIETQGENSKKVLQSVQNFPKQLRQSFDEALKIPFSPEYSNIKNIVVCGMGGSRFPAIIIRELFKEELKIPYVVNDDYHLPGFVDENTLVILSSYSGTTEEVLICGEAAYKKKAKITGLCAGKNLEAYLQKIKAPHYIFNPVYNPSGQPRIGFGYSVGGQLGLLVNLGLLHNEKKIISESISEIDSLLKNFSIDISIENNHAKQLALKLYRHYPYFIVSEFFNGVANAIANQTNETAKSISSFRIIPELNHHLMEGLKFPKELQNLAVFIFFYSKFYSPLIQKRFHITQEVVKQNEIKTIWYESRGKNKVEQTFELMGLGSYMSMYLAALYKQDPSLIPYVDYFKKKLSELK